MERSAREKDNILVVDIGNSNIVFAAMVDGQVVHAERLDTVHEESMEDCTMRVRQILGDLLAVDVSFGGGILVSVVPEQTENVRKAIRQVIGIELLVLRAQDVMPVMEICVDRPDKVGLDRLVDAVGAKVKYGYPLMVIDMGTATTINVVDAEGRFIGGMIAPGMRTSFDALCERASQLSQIPLAIPDTLIGRNSEECMQSGLLYGYASMIDGLVERIEAEMNSCPRVIMTGGLASLIHPLCKRSIIYDKFLLPEGLYHIYETNRKNSPDK